IDGIKSFTEVFKMASNESKLKNYVTVRSNSNINQKSKIMTVDELKQSHPETYNSIFNSGKTAGVSEEKDRTGSWLAHIGTDQQIVVEGIKSGNKISDTQREELLVAASAKRGLENLRVDSAQPIST